MIRYHACGRPIWVQKTWDGMKYYRAYYDPTTTQHITHCPECGEPLRGGGLHLKSPNHLETDWDWLWMKLHEEIGEERVARLRDALRERKRNGQQEQRLDRYRDDLPRLEQNLADLERAGIESPKTRRLRRMVERRRHHLAQSKPTDPHKAPDE